MRGIGLRSEPRAGRVAREQSPSAVDPASMSAWLKVNHLYSTDHLLLWPQTLCHLDGGRFHRDALNPERFRPRYERAQVLGESEATARRPGGERGARRNKSGAPM